ncbi:hypothetical protein DFH09DRAFT_939305, partial [Mycena vulgaris]
LRTVLLPNATLPRFLAIASANTARNLETCGLLLGAEIVKGELRSVITSSTCPLFLSAFAIPGEEDEESRVLYEYRAERVASVPIGYMDIYHPWCSRVHSHTHASFQCMLPESFAVVCAPKSTPNFGIFRITDPPGLQTVLKCTAKQAFHPHPDVPIYRDADRGHVPDAQCGFGDRESAVGLSPHLSCLLRCCMFLYVCSSQVRGLVVA